MHLTYVNHVMDQVHSLSSSLYEAMVDGDDVNEIIDEFTKILKEIKTDDEI